MRYLTLASDYDGTLAHDGVVNDSTIAAIERLVHSGRTLILVTGRELPELESVFPRLDLCSRVVAENGALLYNPATREKRRLAERPPDSFIEDLKQRGVSNLSVGEVIVATWAPFQREAIEAIQASGLELQIIFNKEAVMILPSGVNKRSGLHAALAELKLSRHNVVGIGDAENDHAFLDSCECSVAVANAIPSLKERATFVTQQSRGAGVEELIDQLLSDDLAHVCSSSTRGCIALGSLENDQITLPCYGRNVLVCGQSGSGKSTFVTGVIEQILKHDYQVCLIDPEGDYETLENFRTVGDEKHAPSVKEVMQVLEDPCVSVIVNLVGVPAADRAGCFASIITQIQQLRSDRGRPHWLIIDEAHHVLPSEWAPASSELVGQLNNTVLITVHPEHTSRAALQRIDTVVTVGREADQPMKEFASVVGIDPPEVPGQDLNQGQAAIWFVDQKRVFFDVKAVKSRQEHHRHKRKYAEGQLEEARIFRFRGPGNKLNLPANNLMMFVQLAEGIDADTWQFHLKRGDYSLWFRDLIKDKEVASQIEIIEQRDNLSDEDSRQAIKEAIMQKYTAPA